MELMKLLNNRCPWCGKKINRYINQKEILPQKTPANLRFARCFHCHNYYGQNLKSKRNILLLLTALMLFTVGAIFENIYIMCLSLPVAVLILFTPLKKMDEKEEVIAFQNTELEAFVTERYKKIHIHDIYFFSIDFDQYECFSTVSPIYIIRSNKNRLVVSFLYEHPQNIELLNRNNVLIYNSNMKATAKISFQQKGQNL